MDEDMKRYAATAALLLLAIAIPVVLGSSDLLTTPLDHKYGFPFAYLELRFNTDEHGFHLISDQFRPVVFACYILISSFFAFWAGTVWSRGKN